jgi:hypothetical protein
LRLFGLTYIVRLMANKGTMAEQSNSGSSGKGPSLDAAISLLRLGLPAETSVEWISELSQSSRSGIVAVKWPGMAGSPVLLELVPRAPETASADSPATSPLNAKEPGTVVTSVIKRASAAQREVLRARGEHFIDLSGAISIRLPHMLVDRSDLKPVKRSVGLISRRVDPFADRSSLILRIMLEPGDPQRVWGVRELATAAGVGTATASDMLKALTERRLVEIKRRGRAVEVRLGDPSALIDAWTNAYDWRLNRGIAVHAPIGDLAKFLRRLPGLMPPRYRWALTLQAGASLVAPHATWDRVHIYVDLPRSERSHATQALSNIADHAGWQPGNDGRLMLMAPYYATSAWYGLRTAHDLPVVSDLQLILDLWHYPLRGREQAEYMLRQVFARRTARSHETPASQHQTLSVPRATEDGSGE